MIDGPFQDKEISTDVLVIGGGIAGFFAAIKAREQGLSVTLIDKGYAGKSGQTPFPARSAVFNPEWGDDFDFWMGQFSASGEYINNREWTEILIKESYERYQELVSWGFEFDKGPDGKVLRKGSEAPVRDILTGRDGDILRKGFHGGELKTLSFPKRTVGPFLRNEADKRGVRIIDRVTATELIKQDGAVAGAVGIHPYSNRFFVIRAKATVLAAGSGGFRVTGFPVWELTNDAEAMAYRAGAGVSGKEFVSEQTTDLEHPAYGPFLRPGKTVRLKIVNAEGVQLKDIVGPSMTWAFEAHAGRGPVSLVTAEGTFPRVSAVSGMSYHKGSGVWPISTKCATNVPGLYAAGDCCCNYQSGARYAATAGASTVGSWVTGARAGMGAAEYALGVAEASPDKNEIKRVKNLTLSPAERKGGFSPGWVTHVLKSTMMPYFVQYIKHNDRMQAALTQVEFIRDQIVPKLTAQDLHELRLANETKNMVLNAEMNLRAGIFRTESRGFHYREDYPLRDDPTWLAWVVMKEEQGKMKAIKVPVPEEWWPDLTREYEDRYPVRFPGE